MYDAGLLARDLKLYVIGLPAAARLQKIMLPAPAGKHLDVQDNTITEIVNDPIHQTNVSFELALELRGAAMYSPNSLLL
jgi:hypothetical protein